MHTFHGATTLLSMILSWIHMFPNVSIKDWKLVNAIKQTADSGVEDCPRSCITHRTVKLKQSICKMWFSLFFSSVNKFKWEWNHFRRWGPLLRGEDTAVSPLSCLFFVFGTHILISGQVLYLIWSGDCGYLLGCLLNANSAPVLN